MIQQDEYLQRYIGLSDNEMFPLILNDKNITCDREQVKTLRKDKINAYKNIINQSESLHGLPNVKNFIHSYAQKVEHLAICSGATREEIEATLNKLEKGTIKNYFNTIVTIDDVSVGSTEATHSCCKSFRTTTSALFGYRRYAKKGATAAKRAGMSVAALTTSLNHADFENVDLVARSFDEIDAWIQKLGTHS